MDGHIKFPYKIEKGSEFSDEWVHLETAKVITDSIVYRAPACYAEVAETLYNFKIRPDDVFVTTFPKSGTTLTQEMVWLILNDDYETAKSVPLIRRSPLLELYSYLTKEMIEAAKKFSSDKEELKDFPEVIERHWEILENYPGRRIIKSHLPLALLPPYLLESGCKVVYVARNPKDVIVSLFKYRLPNAPKEEFSKLWDFFEKDYLFYTPYWEHVKQGWGNRGNKNFCFMFYEDIVKDKKSAIKKLSKFLDKDMTEEQVDKLVDHMRIENFKKSQSITKLYEHYLPLYETPSKKPVIAREGKVGGWRDYFTDEINDKANKWIEKNYQKTDLRFPVKFE